MQEANLSYGDRKLTTLIVPERPDTPDARMLTDELEAHLEPYYPKSSRHGYSIEKLLQQDVAFFVTRQDGIPAGCGGVQFYGSEYGEIKRMFVRPQFRGLGLARLMLKHLEDYARERDIHVLRLETGIHQNEAIRLYENWGFQNIPSFGEYVEDPLSRFFEKRI
jgi:putative acetyltransferase